jgi:beta-lactamase class A
MTKELLTLVSPAANEFCKDHGYTSTHLGRKFLESAPTDDNYTSAYDTAKLLSEILQGTLVNEEASGKMLEILKGQTVRTKIPTGLPGDFTSANKTGEMPEGYGLGCIENDTAIIWPSNAQPYVLTVLSNDLGGRNDEAIQIIRNIASFTAQHVQEWETGKAPEN